jgi:NADH:ubiquinone oxidoreductase subunit E
MDYMPHWLADNGASAFGEMTASFEEWLAMCQAGCSMASAMVVNGTMISGVAAVSNLKE